MFFKQMNIETNTHYYSLHSNTQMQCYTSISTTATTPLPMRHSTMQWLLGSWVHPGEYASSGRYHNSYLYGFMYITCKYLKHQIVQVNF